MTGLQPLLEPKSVAIIGASERENSLGRTLVANMVGAKFHGKIYPINPKSPTILGLPAYSSVLDIPGDVDLAVIATPAATVPAIIRECARKKIPCTIVISSGFKEVGEEGEKLEAEVLSIAKESGMRILGPNCLGCMNPHIGLNATFAAGCGLKGNIAFISQSGALCTAVLDWSFERELGFSAFVSLGSMSDIEWGDLIEYLGNDPKTDAVIMYMETIGNAETFLKAVAKVAMRKPLCVIKAGRTQAAAKAAASHTGSLAGSDDVFSAAMRQTGVLRVATIDELSEVALWLSKQPIPKGSHLTIVTNAGGPGVLATDAAALAGAELTELSKDAIASLSKVLPAAWSHGNPIDVLGDADAKRYVEAIAKALEEPSTDGLLVILTPQDMTDSTGTARALVERVKQCKKPLLASWMGGATVAEGKEILKKAGIPLFDYPDNAAHAFAMLSDHHKHLQVLAKSEQEHHSLPESVKIELEKQIRVASQSGAKILSESTSKEILHSAGIPVVRNLLATSAKEAAAVAQNIGYPVVLKLHSSTVTHKTDVGGVKLHLKDEAAVLKAYQEIEESVTKMVGKSAFEGVAVQQMVSMKGVEVILGSSVDPQWGPVILFGAGGELVEVYKDRSLGLPPLNRVVARQMIEDTKIVQVLKGARGRKPVSIDALVDLLVKFSLFIDALPMIAECDINPLLVSSEGFIALDARIVLKDTPRI
ncbi:MAG: acetate--CoA ligase family protein [Simkania sp.]|nr:acetate--CoA ligase family protein [Simkania sp.]